MEPELGSFINILTVFGLAVMPLGLLGYALRRRFSQGLAKIPAEGRARLLDSARKLLRMNRLALVLWPIALILSVLGWATLGDPQLLALAPLIVVIFLNSWIIQINQRWLAAELEKGGS